jgi:hypothetical protein
MKTPQKSQMAQKEINQGKAKESSHSKLSETNSPNTRNACSPPYVEFIMFLLSITRLPKSSTNFVHILSPFGNELIKHYLREA